MSDTTTTSDNQQNIHIQEQGKKVKTKTTANAPIGEEKLTGTLTHEQRGKEKIEHQADENLLPRFSSDQFRRSDDWQRSAGVSQSKRSALRDRLRAIDNPDRLRREIRKIRKNEFTDNDYLPIAPWEGEPNPENAPRDMRKRTYDQLDDVDDFRREIESRVADLNRNNDVLESVTLQEVLRLYNKDAKEIRDERELRKRLEDLDALVAILGNVKMRDEL